MSSFSSVSKAASCQRRRRLSMCAKKIRHSHKGKFALCISFLQGELQLMPLGNILNVRMFSNEGVRRSLVFFLKENAK